MIRAVSFDFHDTVAICPRWFQLETRHLVSATHAHLVEGGHLPPGLAAADLDATYRQLRLEIHEHGRESDAVACVVEVLRRAGVDCPLPAAAEAVELLQRATFAECRPRPGIVAAVRELAAAGL